MIKNITLTNEHCLDLLDRLEDNSVDLILIDPPYEISRKEGINISSGGSKKYHKYLMDYGEWDYNFDYLDLVIDEAYQKLKKGGTLICFYDVYKISYLKEYMENSKFKQIRMVEWIKTNPVPLNCKGNYMNNCREVALTGVKGGKPTFNNGGKASKGMYAYPICRDKGRFHPTQKPLALIEELIKIHSNDGDIILDCFSGSGTTAVATLKVGGNRKFIGCELDENFYNKSVDRINSYTEEQSNIKKAA